MRGARKRGSASTRTGERKCQEEKGGGRGEGRPSRGRGDQGGGTEKILGASPSLPLSLAQGLLHRSLCSQRESVARSPFRRVPESSGGLCCAACLPCRLRGWGSGRVVHLTRTQPHGLCPIRALPAPALTLTLWAPRPWRPASPATLPSSVGPVSPHVCISCSEVISPSTRLDAPQDLLQRLPRTRQQGTEGNKSGQKWGGRWAGVVGDLHCQGSRKCPGRGQQQERTEVRVELMEGPSWPGVRTRGRAPGAQAS